MQLQLGITQQAQNVAVTLCKGCTAMLQFGFICNMVLVAATLYFDIGLQHPNNVAERSP